MVTAEMHVAKNQRFFDFRVEFGSLDYHWLNGVTPVLLRRECRVLRVQLASDACVSTNVGMGTTEPIDYTVPSAAMLRRGSMVVSVLRGVAW